MKNKKRILSKKIVVPIVALGIVVVATISSTNIVSAHQQEASKETLAGRIATKFGLNENEVKETFQEFRFEHKGERHEKMSNMVEKRLEQAVEDGNLTSDQMYAALEKHEELEGRLDDLYDLSPEERREAKADMHEEMQTWASENDISLNKFKNFRPMMEHRGMMK